jgi:hypothetical protein
MSKPDTGETTIASPSVFKILKEILRAEAPLFVFLCTQAVFSFNGF